MEKYKRGKIRSTNRVKDRKRDKIEIDSRYKGGSPNVLRRRGEVGVEGV
jgi:hypothetical protein